MKVYIYSPGDPNVGINSVDILVDFPFNFQQDDYRESTREILKECFSEIMDDPNIYVIFIDEAEELGYFREG